jgi:DNA polymerase-3 subunit gamma/tau
MVYQVLARKWRPKQFEDVVGQQHVTRTLQNAIRQDKLAHAYLFTGTRGVGKTSIARLFAKAIRCLERKSDFNPCLDCASCKDIDSGSSLNYTEIDGASNNSVDDVRALIDSVQYLPTTGRHKIYVIDEVHMLSVPAFNALLKTLEEPPEHTLFILATTDPNKLLGTVISRCQKYDFKNVSVEVLKKHIEKISEAEGVTFSNTLLIKKLAELGKGSVRDTLSIFDQVLGFTTSNIVTEEAFSQSLGLAGRYAMKDMLTYIVSGEPKKTASIYRDLLDENVDLKKLCDQIIDGFYLIINSIDDHASLSNDEIIDTDCLKDVTLAELFWIYESLVKDISWALLTINPEKVVLIILQKISLRRSILSGSDLKISEIPTGDKSNITQSNLNKSQQKEEKVLKTWNGFIDFLKQKSPTTAANLSYGNPLHEIDFNSSPCLIQIFFPEDSSVFKDYLEEKDVKERLKLLLSEFFEKEVSQIILKTQVLSNKDKMDKNFKSKIEIEDEEKSTRNNEKRRSILNNPYVNEAEKLFNSKIDKVILND